MSDTYFEQRPGKAGFVGWSLTGLAIAVLAVAYWAPSLSNRDAGMAAMEHAMHSEANTRQASASARPATIVRPIACDKLPNVPGKSITMVVVDFPPGAYSPRHRHPGSVTAFVLRGSVRSQLGGGPVETFSVGQTWFEPPGTIHMFAENVSLTEPASLLATFVVDDNCGPLTIPD